MPWRCWGYSSCLQVCSDILKFNCESSRRPWHSSHPATSRLLRSRPPAQTRSSTTRGALPSRRAAVRKLAGGEEERNQPPEPYAAVPAATPVFPCRMLTLLGGLLHAMAVMLPIGPEFNRAQPACTVPLRRRVCKAAATPARALLPPASVGKRPPCYIHSRPVPPPPMLQLSERFQVDLEELQDYNQQVGASDLFFCRYRWSHQMSFWHW